MAKKPTYEELEQSAKKLEEEVVKRKQAENALRKSEEKFRLLYERAPLGYQSLDEHGHFLEVNQAWLDTLGYTREEVIGKSFSDFLHPEWRNYFKENFPRFKAIGEIPDVEFEMVKKDRSLIMVNINGKIGRDEKGDFKQTHCILHDITAQKKSEEVLQKSEFFSKTLIDAISTPVFYKDRAGKYLGFNSAFGRFFGATKERLIGKSVFDIHSPELAEVYHRHDEELFNNGGVQIYESQWRTSNGELHDIIFNKATFNDSEGNIRGLIGTIIDITSRKRSEEALRESEAQKTAILDATIDTIRLVDKDMRVIWANKANTAELKTGLEQLVGNTCYEALLGRDTPCPGCPTQKALESDRIEHAVIAQTDIKGFKGRSFWEDYAVPIKNKSGDIVNLIQIARNITDYKEAEEALKERESNLRQIIDLVPHFIFVKDEKGKYIIVNKAAADAYGTTVENLTGNSDMDFASNKADAASFIKDDLEVIQSGEQKFIPEEQITDSKGNIRFLQTTKIPFKTTMTKKSAILGIAIDITERVESEKERVALQAKLQHAQKMEAIGTLAGGVAHDLNNILGGLVSYPELLLLQLPEDSPLRKSILTIQKSGEKAAAVVQDLLTLARRGVVATEVVNLNDVIAEYLKSPEHEKLQSYHPGVHMNTHLEKDTLNILGSSTHLSKTVMNLVSNAAEAMPEGGMLTVSTENRYIDRPIRGYDNVKEGDYVVLIISDTGIGISPDDMEKIFEPFYTKKKMGRSGTGLGMAVVWGTVKDHNGYIDVQSTERKGTTFTLYFPVTRDKLPEDKSHFTIGSYGGDGESILVIDDVEEQRNIASGMLKELGYSVAMVSSGEEAVEYLKTRKADLLLLDMIMDPGLDGFETYKKILELHPGQKALIASGFSETDRVKGLQRLGAGAYIKKPFLLEKIGIAVKEELGK